MGHRKMSATRNKNKLVFGVGRNDADYPVTVHEVINGRSRTVGACPIYTAWHSMLRRCFSAVLHAKRPSYLGCTVDTSWLTFSVFRRWMLTQDWGGKVLDKDILVEGNKRYSPDTCVFVSNAVNGFVTDHAAARGGYPIGVHWVPRISKFVANCNSPYTTDRGYLGVFPTAAEAHLAWAAKKLEHACALAEEQTDHRVADALVRRYERTLTTAKRALTAPA